MNPYDPEKHVWIIDDQLHVIYKFTYDGKLVMTLGTKGKRGRDAGKLFDRPTDIDWLPDGTFFISDGYGGTRVAKFDKDGKFLMDWGGAAEGSEEPGPERVQHRPQHRRSARTAGSSSSIAGTGASRSSIENGKFLDMWTTGVRSSPYAHIITTDQFLWVADGGTNRDRQVRPERAIPVRVGRTGRTAGPVQRSALDHRRSGRQPVSRRSVQRPRAEVPSEARRRSGEARGTGASLYGDVDKLTSRPGCWIIW